MTHSLRKLVDDRKGNVFAVYAIAVPVILFAVGFAVDFGLAAQLRTRLNAAADAAALAALTPNMMTQTTATAQAAATSMFNGQASALTGLTAGSVSVTVTITNPNNNVLIRQVQVCYNASEQTMFAGILGTTAIPLGNCSTAQAQIPPNIDFYVLLDNSPSMQLPSTSAGITQMENLTPYQDTAGCAFACHEASTNNSDTSGNSCNSGSTLTYLGGTTYYCTTTTAPNARMVRRRRKPPTVEKPITIAQSDSRSTTISSRATTTSRLRLDVLSEAMSTLMSTAQTTSNSTPYNPRRPIASRSARWIRFGRSVSPTSCR